MAASNPAGYLPLNECGVITIFPMNSFCSVTNVRGTTGSSWTAEVTVTGGTPPYNVQWTSLNINQSGFGPFLVNTLSGGNYTAVVTDSFGDFTATTTCFVPIVNCTRKPPINPNLAYTCLRDGFGFLTGQATLQINPTGGTSPYVLSGNVNGVVTAITNNMVVSDNDVVTVFVRDYDGCFSTGATNTITIDCPPFIPFDICDTLSGVSVDVNVDIFSEGPTTIFLTYNVGWDVQNLPSNATILNMVYRVTNTKPQKRSLPFNPNYVSLNPPSTPTIENPDLGMVQSELDISTNPLLYLVDCNLSQNCYPPCNQSPIFDLVVDLRIYIEVNGVLCSLCGTATFNEPIICSTPQSFTEPLIIDEICNINNPGRGVCLPLFFDFNLTQSVTSPPNPNIIPYILCTNLQNQNIYVTPNIPGLTYEILTATTTNGVIISPSFPISPTSFNFCQPSGVGNITDLQIDFTGQPNKIATVTLTLLVILPNGCIYFDEFSINIDGSGGTTTDGTNGFYTIPPTNLPRFN